MIIRTEQARIDAYFEDDEHLSQSLIKRLLKGVDVFNKEDGEKDLYYEEKGHFNIGNATDVLLTQGQDEFNEQFAVMTADKPGPKLMSVIHRIFDKYVATKETWEIRHSSLGMSVAPADIIDSASAEGFQPKWNAETMIKNVTKDGQDYFDALCLAFGKQLLSPEEFETVNGITESLKTNILTAWLFPEANNVPEHLHIAYQVPIYFDYMGVKCKALLDIVVIDDAKKTITAYDLKTLGDYTINFSRQVKRMRYDMQAAFYILALRHGIQNKDIFAKLEDDYTIEPFEFVVESSEQQGNPLIYTCDEELNAIGLFGRTDGYTRIYPQTEDIPFPDKIYHQPIHGIVDGIDLFRWHAEHGFDKDRLVVENEGVINLGWNRIY